MSLLDNASLLLTPNAYKEGKLYSVIPSNGNGDFTATRATTATRVNSSGLVDLVPYNLLQYSEMFADAYWVKNLSTVSANVATAPNGTLTADKIIPNTANNFHSINSPYSLNTTFTTVTCSAYLKADGYNFCALIITSSSAFVNYFEGVFNLSNGTIEATGRSVGGYTGTRSIESVGNGWYRCSITLTNAIQNATHGVLITPQSTNNPSSTYAGNGTSGVLAWGAQVEMGVQTTYLRTETRLNIPRIDYSLGGCPNILLEPQRTNLALQSSSFDNASWIKTRSVASANTTISPSGIQDAETITEATFTNNFSGVEQSISVVNGTTYTQSVFVKRGNIDFFALQYFIVGGANGRVIYNLNTKLVTLSSNITSSSITDFPNGWVRISITYTANTSNINFAGYFHTKNSGTLNYNGDGTGFTQIWGAQLEAGAYATSYIPTTTASVTRNADSITRNNIFTNGLITSAGGTWFVELRNNIPLIADNATLGLWLGTSNATSSSNGTLYFRQGGGASRVQIWKFTGGTGTSLFSTTTDTTKVAINWNGTTADIFVNGVKQVSATAFAHNNMEFLNNSTGRNTFINEMALFPTPLTDAQCLALTA